MRADMRRMVNRATDSVRADGSTRLVTPFDPSHETLEFFRRLGAQIHVIHLAKLLGDRKQCFRAQANNVVALFLVVGLAVVGQGHLGSAY